MRSPSVVATAAATIAVLAGCGGGGGASESPAPTASISPSSAPTERGVVTGDVYSIQTGAVADAPVNLWVQTGSSGYSWWYANGPLYTDALGQFTAANLPDATALIWVHTPGYVQPCAVRTRVGPGTTRVRVELMPASAFESGTPSPPQNSVDPIAVGRVFERTASGRVLLPGVGAYAVDAMGDPHADTVTDANGLFHLCALDAGLSVELWKRGYVTRNVSLNEFQGPAAIDIELQREE